MRVNQIEIAEDRNKYTVMLAVPKHSSQEKKMQAKKAALFGFQMNMYNMFVVFSVALILCVSIIQAAPADVDSTVTPTSTQAPSTEMTSSSVTPGSAVETTTEKKICHYRTPCGWAVYTPFVRRIEYFMRNTCVCPPDKSCVRTNDDLSVAAYVYRCGNKTDPSEAPENYYIEY